MPIVPHQAVANAQFDLGLCKKNSPYKEEYLMNTVHVFQDIFLYIYLSSLELPRPDSSNIFGISFLISFIKTYVVTPH